MQLHKTLQGNFTSPAYQHLVCPGAHHAIFSTCACRVACRFLGLLKPKQITNLPEDRRLIREALAV